MKSTYKRDVGHIHSACSMRKLFWFPPQTPTSFAHPPIKILGGATVDKVSKRVEFRLYGNN